MTRSILNDEFKSDVTIGGGAFKLIHVIYDAASNGTVSSIPTKEGITCKLESPTGVNLFLRNFCDFDDENDSEDEEIIAEEEENDSDEEFDEE